MAWLPKSVDFRVCLKSYTPGTSVASSAFQEGVRELMRIGHHSVIFDFDDVDCRGVICLVCQPRSLSRRFPQTVPDIAPNVGWHRDFPR